MCGGQIVTPPIVREKRRNSEKRKEKSRDAARCRRNKESEIFADLSAQLPIPERVAAGLDKASIMRLSVQFLKVQRMIKNLAAKSSHVASSFDLLCATAMNGFLLVLSEDGDIVYLSEQVEELLGISQVEMMGHSLYEFAHPCDHEEIKDLLSTKIVPKIDGKCTKEAISVFARMKSTIKSRGRTGNIKSAPYQVIHYTGCRFNKSQLIEEVSPALYLVFIGNTIPHPAQVDIPLQKDVFVSRHSLDMKFTHVDERISEYLQYTNAELIGKSAYALHHTADVEALHACFKILFHKGQCETDCYRFLAKYGGHVWLRTQATLIYDNNKPDCVVCLNYVLSKVEDQNEIVSEEQEEVPLLSGYSDISEDEIASEEEQDEIPLLSGYEDEALCEEELNQFALVQKEAPRATFSSSGVVMSKELQNYTDTGGVLFQEPLKSPKMHLELDFLAEDGCSSGNSLCEDFSYRDHSLPSPDFCTTPESSLHMSGSNTMSPSTPDSGQFSSLDPMDEFTDLDIKFDLGSSMSDTDSDCFDVSSPLTDSPFRSPFVPSMEDCSLLMDPEVMWGPPEPPRPQKTPKERFSLKTMSPNNLKHKPVNADHLQSSLAALLQSDTKKHPEGNARKCIVNNNNNKRWSNNNNKTSCSKQPRSMQQQPRNSGHIIMLDNIPIKRQNSRAAPQQKRNSQTSTQAPPHMGSHTAKIVKVNDRLIQVQVSISDVSSTSPIEHKRPFPSPPDPPPKRALPSHDAPQPASKRQKTDDGQICSSAQKESVLLNLLISGEDASRGYLCSGNNRYAANKMEPATLSLSSSSRGVQQEDVFSQEFYSETDLLDSFLKISQYDSSETNSLLQGDDLLLSALDHPLLRNVSTLV